MSLKFVGFCCLVYKGLVGSIILPFISFSCLIHAPVFLGVLFFVQLSLGLRKIGSFVYIRISVTSDKLHSWFR